MFTNLSLVATAAYLVAFSFLAMGVGALLNPTIVGTYFQTPIVTVDMRNEIRAVYGGLGIAAALALILAAHSEILRPGIIGCVSLMLAGMALARLASALIERPGRWPWVFCAIEAGSACLLAAPEFL